MSCARQGRARAVAAALAIVCIQAVAGIATAEESTNRITAVRLDQRGRQTVVTIVGSARPAYNVYSLRSPNRLVVDLPSSRLEGLPRHLDGGETQVEGIALSQRAGRRGQQGRLVISLRGEAAYRTRVEGNNLTITLTGAPEATDVEDDAGAARRARADREREEALLRRARAEAAQAVEERERLERAAAEARRARAQAEGTAAEGLAQAEAARARAEQARREAEAALQRARLERERVERRAQQAEQQAAERAEALRRAQARAEELAERFDAVQRRAEEAARAQAQAEERLRRADGNGRVRARQEVQRLTRAAAAARQAAEEAQAARERAEGEAERLTADTREVQSQLAAARRALAETREAASQAEAAHRAAVSRAEAAEGRVAQERQARQEAERRAREAEAERRRAEQALELALRQRRGAEVLAEQRAEAMAQAQARAEELAGEARDAQQRAEAAENARREAEQRAERAAQAARQAEAARAQAEEQARRAAGEHQDRARREVERLTQAAAEAQRAAEQARAARLAAEREARRRVAAAGLVQQRLEQAEQRLAAAREAAAEAEAARARAEERATAAEEARDEAIRGRAAAESAAEAARQEAQEARQAQAQAEAAALQAQARAERVEREAQERALAAERRAQEAQARVAAAEREANEARTQAEREAQAARAQVAAAEREANEARAQAEREAQAARARVAAVEGEARQARARAEREAQAAQARATRAERAAQQAEARASRLAKRRSSADRGAIERAAREAREARARAQAAAREAHQAREAQTRAEQQAQREARQARTRAERTAAEAEARVEAAEREARQAQARAEAAAREAQARAEAAEREAREIRASAAAAERAADERIARAEREAAARVAAAQRAADEAVARAEAEREREPSAPAESEPEAREAPSTAESDVPQEDAAARLARLAKSGRRLTQEEIRLLRLAEMRGEEAVQQQAGGDDIPEADGEAEEGPPEEVARPTIRDVRFDTDGEVSRVTIDLTGRVEYTLARDPVGNATLELHGAVVPRLMARTLDVTEFDSPVSAVSTFTRDDAEDAVVEVEVQDQALSRVRRQGNRIVLEFRAAAERRAEPAGERRAEAPSGEPARDGDGERSPGSVVVAREDVGEYQYGEEEAAGFVGAVPMEQRRVRRRQNYRGRRIDLDFKDADIHNILRLLSDIGRVNIVAADDVAGTVTIKMRNVPWDQALDVILRSKGLGMVREGNLIRVAPITKLEKEREMELARRKHAIQLAPLETRIIPISYAMAAEIMPRAQELLSSRGTISVDERTNVLIARDLSATLDQIEELVRALDTQTPQVLIEARIVEATSNRVRQIGIQWGGDFVASSATGNPTGIAFPSTIGLAGGAMDQETQSSGLGLTSTAQPNPNFAVNLPATVGTGSGGALGLQLGSVDGTAHLNIRLSALEDTGTLRIISSPRILTMDNTEAHIEQGTLIPYSQISAQGVQTAFQEAKLNLTVTPHVTADGSILLKMTITRDEPDFNNRGARGDPTILKREAETQFLVHDGHTVVIGGIYTRNSGINYNQVPGLGRIPILGWLFKNRRESDRRSEMLIFITPRIVNRAESIGR